MVVVLNINDCQKHMSPRERLPTGENLKVVWAVFHFKLACFNITKEMQGVNAWPCLKLTTLPRFCLLA
jgi:hypothetical protein